MPLNWTEQQKLAITEKGKNVLVSAAAGSGKTAVLVERVIGLVTDPSSPVPIDRLLIVTFTNAAANGMQVKIREALKTMLDQNPDSEYLAKQLTLFPRAMITTVHSFCQTLIRNNFHRLGIAADFEIGDETSLSLLRQKAFDTVIENRYENPTHAFDSLVGGFGGKRDDSALFGIVLSLFFFTQSTENPKAWLKSARDDYFSGSGIKKWAGYILSCAEVEAMSMAGEYEKALTVIESAIGLDNYRDTFIYERDMLLSLADSFKTDWDRAREALSCVEFDKLPRKKKDSDDSAAAYVQKIRNGVKKHISKLSDTFFAPLSDIERDNGFLGAVVGELCDIVSDFSDEYALEKRNKNLLDFNDLEHLALLLLQDTDAADEIKNRFDYVLVDEYQDTNGVQDAIFRAVSRGDNLFMVGDVKQSIYGFRNARPDIFTNRADDFSDSPEKGKLIFLPHNYRSANPIIDFVNGIFERLMSTAYGGVDYTKGHALVCGRAEKVEFSRVELHIIDKRLEESEELTEDEQLTAEIVREAMFTAGRIKRLVEVEKPEITDPTTGETRPIRYSDIAILARKNKNVVSIFSEQLKSLGVPFYCEDDTGNFLISGEISPVMSLLKIIDNPLSDIPLLATMRSPLFMFSDEELALIRSEAEGPFYYAVQKSSNPKCKAFLDTLARYRKMSFDESIEFLIQTILSETGYLSFSSSMPGGKTRAANLRLLCERAGRFEAGGYKGISDFISYTEAMEEFSQGYSVAKIAGQNDNAVSIMSIHKSKGLEFPVVFFVRCGERFNKTDLSAGIQYDVELGLGCNFVDTDRMIKYPSLAKLAIARKKLYSLLSEEMRIMYVALTRARDMLYVVGSCVKVNDKLEAWEGADCTPFSIAAQNTFLEWLGMALGKKVRSFAEVHSASDIVIQSRVTASAQDIKPQGAESAEYSEEVAKRLSYTYPYLNSKYIPAKLPVSRAVGYTPRSLNLKKPDFMQKTDRITAALRGTVIHFVLQNIDIQKTGNQEDIQKQIEDMVMKGMLEAELAKVVNAGDIENFFKSNAGIRMKRSPRVEREVKFFVDVPAREIMDISDEAVADETVLLQGVVDCWFEEDGEIVIIDYKTGDSDKPEYKKQLDFYAKGLSKTLGKKVRETVLYPLI
ncbi:MAG: ATP-dependent helicase/nuclease subunit A [Firmicutes bacterium ADurb.Bin193]|nr:MAG: ATP-dependent helicase/nuclease subunit A [Firmicutes bacterium ADurb.Bin193]